ncbi:MAG: hypothetical protein AAGF20_04910, partial [Pseudomonadota bacterium]
MATKVKEATIRPAKLPVYRSADSLLKKALGDMGEGLRMAPMWVPLSLRETFTQFRRFFLGPFWIPLGMMVLVYVLGYAYSYIFQRNYWYYTTYLFAGFLNWQIIQASLMGGFGLFTRQGRAMSHVRMPYTYYIYKHTFEALLNWLIVLPFLLIILIVPYALGDMASPEQPRLSLTALWAIPAFGVYALASVFSVTLFAVVSVRVRDLEAPIASILRILFLITPVIWIAEEREGSRRAAFIDYNPFYHFLEIGRAP